MEFNQSETRQCLARVFAAVCQDGARYEFISKYADNEGYGAISSYFKNLAHHKMAHASAIYKLMLENINGRKDNIPIEAGYPFESYKLSTSLSGSAETEEFEGINLFPHFAKLAHDEGFLQIEKTLLLISEVCLKFAQNLKIIADQFDKKLLYKSNITHLWHCTNCGHEEEGKNAWNTCPLCSYPQGYVKLSIDEKV